MRVFIVALLLSACASIPGVSATGCPMTQQEIERCADGDCVVVSKKKLAEYLALKEIEARERARDEAMKFFSRES
jgi:uncharacterized lipoprotein YmbA